MLLIYCRFLRSYGRVAKVPFAVALDKGVTTGIARPTNCVTLVELLFAIHTLPAPSIATDCGPESILLENPVVGDTGTPPEVNSETELFPKFAVQMLLPPSRAMA